MSLQATNDGSARPCCRSWLMYGFSFLTITCSAGLVYGWPALRRNLVQEEDSALSEESLGAIFTVGAWSTQGGRFFFGLARDYCLGTRLTTSLALLCVACGCLGIALAHQDNGLALGASMFFVGLGSGSQLCLQPIAGLFPSKMQGLLLSSLSGAFQISGLVFLVLTAISSDRLPTFGSYAVILGLFLIVAMWILPKNKFEMPPTTIDETEREEEYEEDGDDEKEEAKDFPKESNENQNDDQTDCCESPKVSAEESMLGVTDPGVGDSEPAPPDANNKADIDTAVYTCEPEDGSTSRPLDNEQDDQSKTMEETHNNDEPPTAMQQLKRREYILLVFWFSVVIIPLQYYVATIGFQLEEKGDDSGVYTGAFSITYAASASMAPVVGKIADVAGLGIAQGIATILVAMSLIVLAGTSNLNAQVFGMICYGIGRMMVFGMFFTNVGKRFGYVHYGTLAGLGLLLSAIASLLQYPLIALAANGHETPVNISCAVALLCTLPYCGWLWRREGKEET